MRPATILLPALLLVAAACAPIRPMVTAAPAPTSPPAARSVEPPAPTTHTPPAADVEGEGLTAADARRVLVLARAVDESGLALDGLSGELRTALVQGLRRAGLEPTPALAVEPGSGRIVVYLDAQVVEHAEGLGLTYTLNSAWLGLPADGGTTSLWHAEPRTISGTLETLPAALLAVLADDIRQLKAQVYP